MDRSIEQPILTFPLFLPTLLAVGPWFHNFKRYRNHTVRDLSGLALHRIDSEHTLRLIAIALLRPIQLIRGTFFLFACLFEDS